MNASEYDEDVAVPHDPYTDQDADGPVKLFVGQVPRNMEEDELRPVLEIFGSLEDLVIIRDKLTGAHRGCAFASYFTQEAAEKAVQELHNKVVLPQSLNPLQVRPAEGQAGASQEHKLFIGMIPKGADEGAIRHVFELFGAIEEVYILRHPATGQSKGCAFLKFNDRASALAAIEQVNGIVTMDRGTAPLVVKFADSRRQRLQRARNLAAAAAATAYWPLPPGAGMAFPQLQQLQQQYMQQMQAFGVQAAAAAGINPAGVGLGSSAEAAAGGASPTNSFMYYNPYTGFAAGAAGSPYGFGGPLNGGGSGANFDMPSSSMGAAGMDMPSQGVEAAAKALRATSQLEGPAGANLFIYHLPHDLTDADLATAFAPFGTVISAKVYMDKITGESKGFGFVSYDSADAADAAIASMNGFQIGTKRLKVQHKRIHQRSDYLGVGGDSFVGHDDELASMEYHHQTQHQGMYDLDDGLHSHSEESVASNSNGVAESHNGVDTSLDEAVEKLRIDA
uniref:RRM domain-containing protein n=1 Tax=Hyaloperonospora arabidopsidis (strain Emoy2) TaxID=559515 RepID=M4BQS5_HYAAE